MKAINVIRYQTSDDKVFDVEADAFRHERILEIANFLEKKKIWFESGDSHMNTAGELVDHFVLRSKIDKLRVAIDNYADLKVQDSWKGKEDAADQDDIAKEYEKAVETLRSLLRAL